MRKKESDSLDDEVVQLVGELGELKEILREVSRKLTRIETKVKRGFSATFPKNSEAQLSHTPGNSTKLTALSSAEVLEVYEQLRLSAKNGNEEQVREKLSSMDAAELNLMCWELGVTLTGKNPSRKKMLEAILGRIKQSLMLSRHIDRKAL